VLALLERRRQARRGNATLAFGAGNTVSWLGAVGPEGAVETATSAEAMAPSSEGAVGQAAAADQPAVSTSPPAVAPLAPDEPETLVLDEGNVHSVGAGGECGASGRETAAASTAGRGSGGPVDSSAAVGPSAVALHEATDGLQGDHSKVRPTESTILCRAPSSNPVRQ
jgi:hypothetical protein